MADFIPFTPKGIIKLYRFVPLDETYDNTLHFKTREEQLGYFGCNDVVPTFGRADCKVSFSGQTFTRNERQYVRIEGNACNYYDCNYMAYQNEDFGDMWFFAFIHTVDYVNDYCTEITFDIDVMQSFMWNYELRDCYVLREHSLTDFVGDSLTPETIPDVPYRYSVNKKTGWFDTNLVVLLTTFELDDLDDWRKLPTFNEVNGMPMGAAVTFIPSNSTDSVKQILQNIADKGATDGIITAYLFPQALSTTSGSGREITIDTPLTVESGGTLNGYAPANNKLFTYPYTVITVDVGNATEVYKNELFKEITRGHYAVRFNVKGVLGANPQVIVTPYHYDMPNDNVFETDSARCVVMENFPLVQLSGDNFANWWGQNGFSTRVGIGLDIAKIVVGVAGTVATEGQGKGFTKTALKGATGLVGTANEYVTNMHTPPTQLQSSNGYGLYATNNRDIYVKILQPTAEGARIIDDLFTMFGYATHKVKIPNIRYYNSCRPHFNYVQCQEMSFHWDLFVTEGKGTSVPQRYMDKIRSIYQRGITFWKNPFEVGHYEELKYENRPQ